MGVRRLAVAAGLLVVSACGNDDPSAGPPSAPASPVPVTTTAAPDPADPTGPAAAPDDSWSPWAKGAPAADLTRADPAGFTTADGSVTCLFTPGDTAGDTALVRCDRTEGLGVDEPRPADCQGDWGDAVAAVAGRGGALVCASDTVVGATGATVLADGDAASYGDLTCAVRDDAVQCLTSTPTGYRGFVVSTRVLVTR